MMVEETKKPPFKKYILFVIEQYYPSGGLDDIEGDEDTLEALRPIIAEKSRGCWCWYVLDRDTWERVAAGGMVGTPMHEELASIDVAKIPFTTVNDTPGKW